MSEPRKILIIRLSSLGDILHALPAARSLRAAFPEARIDWLAEKQMSSLLPAIPDIDRIHCIDTQGWRRNPWSLPAAREFRQLLRRLRGEDYDLSLDFQGLLKTALLGYLSGARCRMGFSKELVRERPAHWFYHKTLGGAFGEVHVVRLNLALAQAAGGRPVSLLSDLNASGEDRRAIEFRLEKEQLSEYAVINPGGGWYTKRWKPAKYGELAARIQRDLKLAVVVATGPGEDRLYEEIRQHCGEPSPRHFPIPFGQLIPLCQKARLFVGGDTGPFHLACALGTPVVGIFGPTAPARNGPISEEDEVVVHLLHCSFCYGRACPTQNECMDITVDEVFQAVVRRLDREHANCAGGLP